MPQLHNDAADDPLLFERDDTFRGGCDEFTRPVLLPPGQYARSINAIVADNHEIGTRPGWEKQGDTGETSVIQGAFYYETPAIQQVLICCDGAAQSWDGSTWTARAGYAPTGYVTMAQGFDKLLLTDGTANMRSYNGSAFTDLGSTVTSPGGDPPVGATILCWHTFRMFASGKSTEPDAIWASTLADFAAGSWDHTNMKFRVGTGDGQAIRALASLQNFNLAVFKTGSVYIVNTNPVAPDGTAATAADWTIQQLSGGVGCVGKKAWCYAGNDVLFMAQDGVRSLNRMAAAAGQYEVSAPISQPMQPYIDRINWERAANIVAINYRNYAIFWVPLDTDQTNTTALVFNIRLGVWVGIWTGPDPTCALLTRFFDNLRLCIGTTTGALDEWQDNEDQQLEESVQDEGDDYETLVRLRSTQFGEPVNAKDAYYFEARLRNVTADVTVDLVLDEEFAASFTLSPQAGALVGSVSIPFELAPDGVIVGRKSLDGNQEFNESYLEFSSELGRFTLKSVTRAAFLNTLQNE